LRKKTWSLLILIGLWVIGGGVLFLKKVTVLHLENMDHPRTIRIRVRPPEAFSVFFIHSIYKEPVVEEFEAEGDAIALKGVRTKSPAVMNYYGFEDMKGFHPMHQRMGTVHFMWGVGEGQGLRVGDRTIFLNEIGNSGDRIELRIESMFLLNYLLSEIPK
jgi:hypothetical protein